MATKAKTIKRIVEPLGKAWGRNLQEMVTKAAKVQARFELRSGKHAGKKEVEVVVPVTVHIAFTRRGKSIAGDGGVRCNCTFTVDANGGTCCICRGPDADQCDCLIVV